MLILSVGKTMKELRLRKIDKRLEGVLCLCIPPFLAPTVLGKPPHSAGKFSDGITSTAIVPYQPGAAKT